MSQPSTKKNNDEHLPYCPLCLRQISKSQQDAHHLVPKSKGGRATEVMHRACHRQIHMLFTETELAKNYSTAEDLLQNDEIQKFVTWIKTKPNDFLPQFSPSKRIKKGR